MPTAPTFCPGCLSKRLGVGRWTHDSQPIFKCLDCQRELPDRDSATADFIKDIINRMKK